MLLTLQRPLDSHFFFLLPRFINISLETEIFPKDWMESMVMSVEKIRNTIKCEGISPDKYPENMCEDYWNDS